MNQKVNKHGLTRTIPSHIRYEIRRACGFGCVICGEAICQYEHIDPPYSDAKEHSSDKMALLCGGCHDKVTRKVWSKERVIEARKDPKAKQDGFSKFQLDVDKNNFIITIGDIEFLNLQKIIEIDGEVLLGVSPPPEKNSPPQITAEFFDRNNKKIAGIRNNIWYGESDTFDIQTKSNELKIRNNKREIDLVVSLKPPEKLMIEKLNLRFNGNAIIGDKKKGFNIFTENAKVILPLDKKKIKKASHWVLIENENISLGMDEIITFNKKKISGSVVIKKGELKLEYVNPNTDSPPSLKLGEPIIHMTNKDGNYLSIADMNIDFPSQKKSKKKIGRNQPCPCGSGKKYKKCHGSNL